MIFFSPGKFVHEFPLLHITGKNFSIIVSVQDKMNSNKIHHKNEVNRYHRTINVVNNSDNVDRIKRKVDFDPWHAFTNVDLIGSFLYLYKHD